MDHGRARELLCVRGEVQFLHAAKAQLGGLFPCGWHAPAAALLDREIVVVPTAVLVGGSHDTEEATLGAVVLLAPGVSHHPELDAVLDAPSDDRNDVVDLRHRIVLGEDPTLVLIPATAGQQVRIGALACWATSLKTQN